MARKETNIYKRKDGRWEARYVKEIDLDGRKKYGSVFGRTYTEAQLKRLEILRNIRPYGATSNSFVLSDIMREWLQYVRHNIKPNTFQKYDSVIRNHIETHFLGKTNLRFLTAKSISNYANQRAESGLSVKTVNDILIVIGLALNYAEEVYHIPKIKVSYLKSRAKKMRVLDISEQKRLEAFLVKEINLYKFAVLLALYTGVRIGELCALDWCDITDKIKISKTFYRIKRGNRTVLEIAEPKTPSSRSRAAVYFCLIILATRERVNIFF